MNRTSRACARTGSGFVAGLGDLPHHREEVLGVAQVVVGVDEGHAHREAVRGGGEGGHLGDEAHDLAVQDLGIVKDLRVLVVGRQGGDRRDQHAHRVRVVVETFEESLADVLVDVRVVRDLFAPTPRPVPRSGQFAVVEQVGHLEVRRVLGQLLDRIAAIAQDAEVAVDEGDGRLGGRGVEEAGVVEPDARHGLGELRARRRHRVQ